MASSRSTKPSAPPTPSPKPPPRPDSTFDTAQAITVMLEKHGIACDVMHGGERQKDEV